MKAAVFMRGIAGYFRHLIANWKVSARAVVLALFHFVHGIIPVKYTSHNWWGFSLRGKKER
jgi:membrane protein YdbS with pleckstrin-like domain